MDLTDEPELANAQRTLRAFGIEADPHNSGGQVVVLRVERSTDEAFVYISCEGEENGAALYVVGYYANEDADGETVTDCVDESGLVWIITAFRRGVVAGW